MVNINNTIYTAVVTPMLENSSIDFKSFEYLLRKQEASNCGILILGSTGEALALSYEEHCQLVKFTSNLKLKVPVIVGVGGYKLQQQCEWINFCNSHNIDGFLMVTPIYAKPGTQGQIAWFTALLETAQKPCMLYNVPSRSGINLCFEALKNIRNHHNLWALKEASGDVKRFQHYIEVAPNLSIYSGEDAMMPELAKFGAKGLVSVVSNIWPKETKKYVSSSLNHDVSMELSALWSSAASACFSAANPIPVKVWLSHIGELITDTLRLPLTAKDLSSIKCLQDADRAIKVHYSI